MRDAIYIALIHQEGESDFGVSFPDFPGVVTAGKTLHQVSRMAREALEFHIEGMLEDGEDILEPSTLDQALKEVENRSFGAAILVPVQLEQAVVRVNVTFSEQALKEIDAYAAAHGMSRSGFLAHAARSMIKRQTAG